MTESASRPEVGIVPYIVAGCMFMEGLDGTAIVTALPTMARSFGTDPATLGLGISSYLVAVAVFLPLNTWLADRFGTRTVMCWAIVAFTLSSLWCGLSTALAPFIAARIVQGAAAAMMAPSGRLAVMRETPKDRLVEVVAVMVWPALIAPVLGPLLGGLLTSYASWHWIFFLNAPIGCVGLLLAARYVPQQRDAPGAFDLPGFVLCATTLATLIIGLEMLGSRNIAVGLGFVAVGGASAWAAYLHLGGTPQPIVDLAPARIKSFSISTLTGGAASRVAVSATPFLLPLLFQIVFGYSAFEAGAMTLVYFAGNLTMKTFTTRIVRRMGFRRLLIGNGIAVAAAILACAGIALHPPAVVIAGVLFLSGATRSLQFTALNTLAFADVPPALTGHANTLSNLAQQVAITFGVALAATLLAASQSWRGGVAASQSDFLFAFLVVAAIGFAAVPSYLRLPRNVGTVVSGARA